MQEGNQYIRIPIAAAPRPGIPATVTKVGIVLHEDGRPKGLQAYEARRINNKKIKFLNALESQLGTSFLVIGDRVVLFPATLAQLESWLSIDVPVEDEDTKFYAVEIPRGFQ